MADIFLEQIENRKRSAAHEVRWLNLGGFCLRPGFGYIGDEYRIEQVRRIYAAGPQFGNQTQNEIDWWIFWGRLAGGLNRNQQVDIVQRLLPLLVPRPGKKVQRINNSLLREMWRTASSMELDPACDAASSSEMPCSRGGGGGEAKEDYVLWCLSRLGARQLFYGPANQVLAPSIASRWTESLLASPKADDALVSLARRTGDPVCDVSAASFRRRARAINRSASRRPTRSRSRARRTSARPHTFGEGLPSGLVLGL